MLFRLLTLAFFFTPFLTFATEEGSEDAWDIESPPGATVQQEIDVTEGTWINLDVSPDGNQIVFDLLGDLYLMPITGAHGTKAPTKLTSGVAWDMQPRFSPDLDDWPWSQWQLVNAGHTGVHIT